MGSEMCIRDSFLATKGLETYAWDISSNAISQLQLQSNKNDIAIQVEVRDVVERPPSPQSFDVIVVSRFLDRSIVDAIIAASEASMDCIATKFKPR